MTPPVGKRSQADLVKALVARDPQSLAELYDQYSRLIYSVLLRMTHDRSVAEDLMQEAFLRAWMRIEDFDPDRGTLPIWLVAISRNLAFDSLRVTRGRLNVQWGNLQQMECSPASNQRNSSFENADLIAKTFLSLTTYQRRLLEMAYFEGCSQSEIAARLRTPLGTVKSRMRSAIQQVRIAFHNLSAIPNLN